MYISSLLFAEDASIVEKKRMELSNSQKKKIHNRRFDEMRETKSLIKVEYEALKSIIRKYRLFADDKLEDFVFHLFERKMSVKENNSGKDTNVPLRAYFIRKVIEYLCVYKIDDYWTETKLTALKNKLGFIAEVVIVIQYLENQILDKKYISTDNHINQNLIASNVLRGGLYQYIEEALMNEFGFKKTYKIISTVRKIFLYVDLGQRIDKTYNHYDSYKKDFWKEEPNYDKNSILYQVTEQLEPAKAIIEEIQSNEELDYKKYYIDLYFRRIFLTNVSLFTYFSELVAELLEVPYKQQSEVINFSTNYGLALQVVNDNHDFVYIAPSRRVNGETVAKKSTDAFSDLRNRNITLPLIFHLSKGYKRLIESYLNEPKEHILKYFRNEISKEIKQSFAIRKSITVGRRLAASAISFLDKSNPVTLYLTDLCGIAHWNRFYHEFYPSKADAKPLKNH